MKPTYGAVSRSGLIAFASSLDQVGPFARTVRDAALLLSHIVGRDELDSTSLDWPEPIALPEATGLEGVRVGVVDELMGDGVEPGVRAAVDAALARIEELGGSVERVSLATTEHGVATYYLIAPAECSSNLARFDGIRYGPRFEDAGDLLEQYEVTRGDRLRPRGEAAHHARHLRPGLGLLRRLLPAGAEGADADPARLRRRLRARGRAGLADLADDGLPHRRAGGGPAGDVPLGRLHDPRPASPGCPRCRSPAGSPTGCPWGSSSPGPAFSENRLLRVAHALEAAIGFDPRPPGVL